MYTVKIANKLEEIYCIKAEMTLNEMYTKFYGIECPNNDFFPCDGNLRLTVLEYYKQFSEEEIEDFLTTSKCLKQIINA